jgi:hypothetical protein
VPDPVKARRTAAVGLTLVAGGSASLAIAFNGRPAVAVYVIATLIVIVLLWRTDRSGGGMFGLAALTLGPLAGPVILFVMSRPPRQTPRRSSELEEEIDLPTRAERICAEIDEGRRPMQKQVPSLAGIFNYGDLADQQEALAAILRHYGPALRPALDMALTSSIPAVRVQAAAVFVQLRDSFTTRARALSEVTTGLSGAALDQEIRAVGLSGFADPQASPDQATFGENASEKVAALTKVSLPQVIGK